MGLLSGISNFFRGIVGDSDEDRKRKQAQQQQNAPKKAPNAPGLVVQPSQDNRTVAVASEAPDNGIKVVVPGNQLQKAKPKPAPAQNVGKDAIKAVENWNPTSDNAVLRPLVKVGAALAKGVAIPALRGGQELTNLQTTGRLENPKQFVGDTISTGLNVVPVGKGIELLKGASTLQKVKEGAKAGATVGGLSTGAQSYGQGDKAKDVATNTAIGAGAGGVIGGALPAAGSLVKAGTNKVKSGIEALLPDSVRKPSPEPAPVAPRGSQPGGELQKSVSSGDNVPQPGQLVKSDSPDGVRSVNPNREVDAAAVQAAQLEKAAQEQLAAVQANTLTKAPAKPTAPAATAADGRPMVEPRREDALQTAIEEAHNSGNNTRVAALIEQLPEDMKPAMRNALGIEPPPPSAPVPGTPAAVTPEVPADAPLASQVQPEAGPATPIVSAAEAGPAAPVVDAPPVLPEAAVPTTAPAAPLTHDAIVKQLGPAASDLKGKFSDREVVNLDELKRNAEGVIANMDDNALLQSFATVGPETMVHDANSFAVARAALERLSQRADDPAAVQTVSNILDGMDRYVSKSGVGLRIAQEQFDVMPLPMKVRYIVKKIDAANRDTKGYQLLADDPAKQAIVEATITGHLQASQAIAEKVAAVEGKLNEIADAALNGRTGTVDLVDPKPLVKQLKQLQQDLQANNGELVKYYQGLVPGRSLGQKVLSDFPRRMMLASFTGRINDLLTTTANVANLGAQNAVGGLLAKAVNLVKGRGTVTDTWQGGSKLFTGGANELKKTKGEIVKGTQYTGDLQKALKGSTDARSGLQKSKGVVGRTIQAATEAATHFSAGVRDQRLYQLAHQEGTQAGLAGQALNDYAEARAAVPSRAMADAAERLHMEMNNLNDNPVTRTLNRVAGAIQGDSAVGGLIKSQIMPFTSWLGGNIWNSVTDKNVVANFVKFADSARKGDAEGLVRNASKFAVNAAQTYGLGYLLTQAGVLTNENAEGYNDGGVYIHLGDRYVPAGFLGFSAPNIVLGNAAYNALNSEDAASPAEKIAKFAGDAIGNLARNINLGGALGVESNLADSYDELTKKGGGAADAASTAAAGLAGQYIPALAGDANAIINNSPLNPTHEKADTKVVDPNSPSGQAKDVPASALRSLENRIPGLSQTLPRKQDVAAPDLLDRTTRGDRETPGGAAAKAQAKTTADQSKDFKARNIPDPNGKNFDDAVQARVEDGDYGSAIEGLQAKLAENQKNKDIPKSKNAEIEKQIKMLKVTRDGKYDPSIIDLYKKTSLTEWRDMGDPESDNYDPETYKKLFNYDAELAGSGVSRNATKETSPFYFAKKDKTGGRGSAASKELSRIKSNTIGDTPGLAKLSLGDLSPQKAGSVKMPTIQQIKAGDLVKKRKITVSKA